MERQTMNSKVLRKQNKIRELKLLNLKNNKTLEGEQLQNNKTETIRAYIINYFFADSKAIQWIEKIIISINSVTIECLCAKKQKRTHFRPYTINSLLII